MPQLIPAGGGGGGGGGAGKIITLADETSTANEYSRTINFDQVDLVNEYAEIRCLVRGQMQSIYQVLAFQMAGLTNYYYYTSFDQYQTYTFKTYRSNRSHITTQGANSSAYYNNYGFNLDLRIFLRKTGNNFDPHASWVHTTHTYAGSRGQAYSSNAVSNGIISQIKFIGRDYDDNSDRQIQSGANYLIQGIKR